jgi:cephalosporin-C deacetylase
MALHGWYCRPAADKKIKFPALLLSPRYGRASVEAPVGPARRGFAVLAWQGRRYEVDKSSYPPENYAYVLNGIEDRYNYAYRALYANAVRGVDILVSRPEVNTERIGAAGTSQGGGLSLAAAALDARVAVVSADFPFMCDIAGSLPVSQGTLPYFDLLNFAPKIKASVKIQAGLRDKACPPKDVKAVFKAVKAPKVLEEFPKAGHGGESALRTAKMLDFVYSALATEK